MFEVAVVVGVEQVNVLIAHAHQRHVHLTAVFALNVVHLGKFYRRILIDSVVAVVTRAVGVNRLNAVHLELVLEVGHHHRCLTILVQVHHLSEVAVVVNIYCAQVELAVVVGVDEHHAMSVSVVLHTYNHLLTVNLGLDELYVFNRLCGFFCRLYHVVNVHLVLSDNGFGCVQVGVVYRVGNIGHVVAADLGALVVEVLIQSPCAKAAHSHTSGYGSCDAGGRFVTLLRSLGSCGNLGDRRKLLLIAVVQCLVDVVHFFVSLLVSIYLFSLFLRYKITSFGAI